MDTQIKTIDCACVLYGSAYSWAYVERLYNMLSRHLSPTVKLHVYTQADCAVPGHMIKHVLTEWPIAHASRAWWYKIQLFNPTHHSGPLLYFDLDTVIVDNIDWIWQHPTRYFWAVKDFKYLWRPTSTDINSSIMWWDTNQHRHVWDNFATQNLTQVMSQYRGDQDYISARIDYNQRRFFDTDKVKSWRWQCLDGGYNFDKKRHFKPGTGTKFDEQTSVLIFHGKPKPDQITDTVVLQHWQ
jgi:hypothetical protein